jgi:hypothetical protein
MFVVCILIAFVLAAGVGISAAWPKISELLKSKATGAGPTPTGHTPMFIDSTGQAFSIETAPPCDATAPACKYVAPVVSITEPCALTQSEEAIKIVIKNNRRIRKAYNDAKQALMEFVTEEKEAAA